MALGIKQLCVSACGVIARVALFIDLMARLLAAHNASATRRPKPSTRIGRWALQGLAVKSALSIIGNIGHYGIFAQWPRDY